MSKTDQITIVQAGHEHLSMLAPLFNAYRVFYKQPHDIEAAHDYLLDRISNLESVIYVALNEGGNQGVGFVQLYPSFSSLSLERIWILYDLFVTPSARGHGIGRKLMERAKELGQATGAGCLELSTAKDNYPAQALYEALGYLKEDEYFFYELELKT